MHYYTCPGGALSSCTNPDPYDPTPVLSQWTGLGATEPVVVTEFGWPSQSSGTYDSNVIAYATEQGWGWSAFAWEDFQHPTEWDVNWRLPQRWHGRARTLGNAGSHRPV